MDGPRCGNVFESLPTPQQGETFSTLLDTAGVRIERIVSHHHASPPGFWYEQAEEEWVVLLRGAASLEFDNGKFRALETGDWLLLPAGCRHRIARTAAETIWLAVHMAK